MGRPAGYRCMRFIEGLLTRPHSFISGESKWELLAVCRAGLFSLRLCRPASPPPALTASSDLTVQQPSMFEQPAVTLTSGNDNREKIDFQQTIIDFQEKTILTSLDAIYYKLLQALKYTVRQMPWCRTVQTLRHQSDSAKMSWVQSVLGPKCLDTVGNLSERIKV